MIIGPKIIKDGLVFGYDGDDRSSRYYPGEPTTNLTLDTILLNGWEGGYSLIDSSIKSFNVTTIANGAPSNNSAWKTFYWDISSCINQTVTISAKVKIVQETNCSFLSFTIGQGNTGTYPYHITGSDSSDRVTISSKPIDYIDMIWTGLINTTGIVGFTLWINNATINTSNCIMEISNVQIEVKSHATQFVNGTRLSTNSLIDLKKTTSIDLSNVSFDSTAHPYFDGTDDKIQTTYSPQFGDFTVCLVFKDDGSETWGRIIDKSYNTGFFISSYFASYGQNYVGAGIIEPNFPHGISLPYTPGKYHFFTSVRNGTTHTIYLDGITQTTSKTVSDTLLDTTSIAVGSWSGSNNQLYKGWLPIVNIYDRVLSPSEILQNYNAYKNRFNI